MKKKAFSLAELLITLIIVSCILAAFAPVITKRMANGGVSIGGSSGPAQQVEANVTIDGMTDDCANSDCRLCIGNACIICDITCPGNLSRDYMNCKCVDCTPFDTNCAVCSQTKCTKCKTGYKIQNGTCVSCSDLAEGKYCDGSSTVQTCPSGSYCENGEIFACPENYYSSSKGSGGCIPCPTGKYAEAGSTECKKCTSAFGNQCTSCTPSGCETCAAPYIVSGQTCIKEDTNILKYNGLSIYKFNAGDEGGPAIPADVKVVNAGTNCSGACCWRATDSKYTATSCTSTGNTDSTYSGCKRTVCNYAAAELICQNIGWRLPKAQEGLTWNSMSAYMGTGGLQLCDRTTSSKGNVRCDEVTNCPGSTNSWCEAEFTWLQDGNALYLTNGQLSSTSISKGYAAHVRCVKDDYEIPEGCLKANSDGNCAICKPGYKLYKGECEFGLESGLSLRYNGLFITKYNAGDKDGAPIPATVTVVDAPVSCSGKCCWRATDSTYTSKDCTSGSGSKADYSGCKRTMCNFSAASDICAQIPGGGWRLATVAEGAWFSKVSSGLGYDGLQLCDRSSSNYGNARCDEVTNCYGSTNNWCEAQFTWLENGYVNYLINGSNYYTTANTGYAANVRCVKEDPNFPDGCLWADSNVIDKCLTCKPGYTLKNGKCTYGLESGLSLRYNGLFITKYNAGDKDGAPIPATVILSDTGGTCSGKCCWRAAALDTATSCTTTSGSNSDYSGCKRTMCNYSAAVDICAQIPGGGWRLPTIQEGMMFSTISGGYGKDGLQLCDRTSANYGNVKCDEVTNCTGATNNWCEVYYTWLENGNGACLNGGKLSYSSLNQGYGAATRCVKEDPNFPEGCLWADSTIVDKCLACKPGYTMNNGKCELNIATLNIGGVEMTKYNAGDKLGVPIPRDIYVVDAGTTCSATKCCWRATDAVKTASSCTTASGTNSDYSGCDRTVCNYAAAVDICAQAPGGGWRLPSSNEYNLLKDNLNLYNNGKGKDGLQLCDRSSSNYGNVRCDEIQSCLGATNNWCEAEYTWGQDGYALYLTNNTLSYPSTTKTYAAHVRCVRDAS